MKAIKEVRSQKSVGSSNGRFGGPDTYVAVQLVPNGVQPLRYLNRKVARQRGITIIYCGEGYSRRQKTSRSMLGAALQKAQRIVDAINGS